MIAILIIGLLMASSVCLFSISYKINGINRAVINAPTTIFEYSVPVVIKDNYKPYFNTNKIIETYDNYINASISRYTNKYDVSYRFYDSSTGGIKENDCDGVEIKVEAEIIPTFTLKRTMFYEVTKKNG